MNKIAPPAILNVSADIFKCVRIKEPKRPKNMSTQKATNEPLSAIHCFCLWWRFSVIERKIGIVPIGSITAKYISARDMNSAIKLFHRWHFWK
jgi:hypothetical protein